MTAVAIAHAADSIATRPSRPSAPGRRRNWRARPGPARSSTRAASSPSGVAKVTRSPSWATSRRSSTRSQPVTARTAISAACTAGAIDACGRDRGRAGSGPPRAAPTTSAARSSGIRPSWMPCGSTSTFGANRWPPRCDDCQSRSGGRWGASASKSGGRGGRSTRRGARGCRRGRSGPRPDRPRRAMVARRARSSEPSSCRAAAPPPLVDRAPDERHALTPVGPAHEQHLPG